MRDIFVIIASIAIGAALAIAILTYTQVRIQNETLARIENAVYKLTNE